MLNCVDVSKEFILAALDWCGQHSALLVAIAGFASSVAIAKITSGLDFRKTLCLRRFDAYENAIGHLALKLNVYYNILAAFHSLNEPFVELNVIKSKVAVLLALFVRFGEVEKEDRNSIGIVLYSKLPAHDVRPLTREVANFIALLQDLSCLSSLPNPGDQLKQSLSNFVSGVKRLEPLVEAEVSYLNAMYDQLSDDIRKNKTVKKLLKEP